MLNTYKTQSLFGDCVFVFIQKTSCFAKKYILRNFYDFCYLLIINYMI